MLFGVLICKTAASSCIHDTDCKEAEVCYSNQTWMEKGEVNFCDCDGVSGWLRDPVTLSCTTLGPIAYYGSASRFVTCFVCLVCAIVVWTDVISAIVATRQLKIGNNALTISLLATSVAFTMLTVSRLLAGLDFFYPLDFRLSSKDSQEFKHGRFTSVTRPFFLMGQIFTVIACLQICGVWIELAYNHTSVLGVLHHHVEIAWALVAFLELLFVVAVGTPTIIGFWDLSAFLSVPFFALLIFAFILGRMKLVFVLRKSIRTLSQYNSSLDDSPERPASMENFSDQSESISSRTQGAITAIEKVSTHAIIGVSVVLSSLCIYLGSLGIYRNTFETRNQVRPGQKFTYLVILTEVIVYGMIYTLVAVTIYIRRALVNLKQREKDYLPSKNDGKERQPLLNTDIAEFEGDF